jgi:hypothetical protein
MTVSFKGAVGLLFDPLFGSMLVMSEENIEGAFHHKNYDILAQHSDIFSG